MNKQQSASEDWENSEGWNKDPDEMLIHLVNAIDRATDEKYLTIRLESLGYEWDCPVCQRINFIPAQMNFVTCHGCDRKFIVNDE